MEQSYFRGAGGLEAVKFLMPMASTWQGSGAWQAVVLDPLCLSDPVPGSQPYVVFPGETLPGGSASNLTHVPLAVLMGEIVEGVSDACDGFLRFSDKSKQGNHTGTWNLPAAGGIMASTSFILSVT